MDNKVVMRLCASLQLCATLAFILILVLNADQCADEPGHCLVNGYDKGRNALIMTRAWDVDMVLALDLDRQRILATAKDFQCRSLNGKPLD